MIPDRAPGPASYKLTESYDSHEAGQAVSLNHMIFTEVGQGGIPSRTYQPHTKGLVWVVCTLASPIAIFEVALEHGQEGAEALPGWH